MPKLRSCHLRLVFVVMARLFPFICVTSVIFVEIFSRVSMITHSYKVAVRNFKTYLEFLPAV